MGPEAKARGGRALSSVSDPSGLAVFSSSSATFIDSRMSFSNDSVSDGVRRVMAGEITPFRFCERVEAAASGFAEFLFDIAIAGSQFRKGFGDSRNVAL